MPIRTLIQMQRQTTTALPFALAIAFFTTAARAAEAVDCDKLTHSKVPYEVTMKIGEAEIKYQVYRQDKHLTTVLIRQPDGTITKLLNEGTFPKTMTLPNGESANFEYSVPTDKPLYDQGVKAVNVKLKHKNDVLLNTPTTVEYLPDEKVTVGSCTFDTKHYVQTTAQNGRESRNELWYAPDLEFGLKGASALKVGGQQIAKQSQAISLTTSFTPLK